MHLNEHDTAVIHYNTVQVDSAFGSADCCRFYISQCDYPPPPPIPPQHPPTNPLPPEEGEDRNTGDILNRVNSFFTSTDLNPAE